VKSTAEIETKRKNWIHVNSEESKAELGGIYTRARLNRLEVKVVSLDV